MEDLMNFGYSAKMALRGGKPFGQSKMGVGLVSFIMRVTLCPLLKRCVNDRFFIDD
jgi:hypothetical protein